MYYYFIHMPDVYKKYMFHAGDEEVRGAECAASPSTYMCVAGSELKYTGIQDKYFTH